MMHRLRRTQVEWHEVVAFVVPIAAAVVLWAAK
jgi:hypothetical protein